MKPLCVYVTLPGNMLQHVAWKRDNISLWLCMYRCGILLQLQLPITLLTRGSSLINPSGVSPLAPHCSFSQIINAWVLK